MPQCSHMIFPSSRWKDVTVRLPFMERRRFRRSSTAATAARASGWLSSTFSSFVEAR